MASDGSTAHTASHDPDFTARNQNHWNQFASKYTEHQWQRDMLGQITAFIHAHIDWIGVKPGDRVLDYACGPGTVTYAIGNRAGQYQGIDLSEQMVKAYNARFKDEQDFQASAVEGNLLADSPLDHLNDTKFSDFDLAAIGLGFHHFENLERCLQRLIARLKPNGTLLIIDLLTHDPEAGYETIVAHNGFSEGQMKKLFGAAGLVDVDIVVMKEDVMMHGTKPRTVFMARGRKGGNKL